MRNRIRVMRQRQGMTLKELADAMATTPQSISRLETGNMTLSTDWLQRFAQALKVHPVELLEGPVSRDIPVIGTIGQNGIIGQADHASLTLDLPGGDLIGVKVGISTGIYRHGDFLVADRLPPERIDEANGRDCVVADATGTMMLARVVRFAAAREVGERGADVHQMLAMSIEGGSHVGPAMTRHSLSWAAPVLMRVSFF